MSTTALTDELFVMVVTGFGQVFLTESQAQSVMVAMDSPEIYNVNLGKKGMYRVQSIHGVAKIDQLDTTDREKRGEFKCKFGKWHERGMKCGCAEAKKWGLL